MNVFHLVPKLPFCNLSIRCFTEMHKLLTLFHISVTKTRWHANFYGTKRNVFYSKEFAQICSIQILNVLTLKYHKYCTNYFMELYFS